MRLDSYNIYLKRSKTLKLAALQIIKKMFETSARSSNQLPLQKMKIHVCLNKSSDFENVLKISYGGETLNH